MWKNSLVLAALLSFGTSLWADTPEFKLAAPWKAADAGEFSIAYPGQGWSMAAGTVKAESGKLNQLEFEAKVQPGNPLRLQLNNDGRIRNVSLDGDGGWNRYRIFFFGGGSGQLRMNFHFNPGPAVEAAVRNVKATAGKSGGNLLADGDFEAGNTFPVDWSKAHTEKSYPARLAPSHEFLNGDKCMELRISADAAHAIYSHPLPLELGKTLKLSFWARGPGEREMTAAIDCYGVYAHTGKHLYAQKQFKVGSEWKKYTLSLKLPEKADEVPVLADRLFRVQLRSEVNADGGILEIEDVEVLCE